MQKGFASLYILISLAIIAAAVGSYYIQKTANIPSKITSSIISQPIPTPAIQNETTNPDLIGANWKTYTSQKLGLTFKLPPSWKQSDLEEDDSLLSNQDYLSYSTLSPERGGGEGEGTEINAIIIVYPVSIKGPHHDFYGKMFENGLSGLMQAKKIGQVSGDKSTISQTLTYTTIDGHKVLVDREIMVKSVPPPGTEACDCNSKDVFIDLNNGKIMEVSAEWVSDYIGFEDTVDQILSTFKFLDQGQGAEAPTSLDLNGFPIYPGLKFVKKEVASHCTGNESGFSTCGSTTYTWISNEADKVSNWYLNDLSGSGWKPGGSAGGYEDGQNFSGQTTFKKGDLRYGVYWTATNNNLEMTLSIPNK
ncbi:MAG: hypothetical protein M1142_01010 [Patescibacteria group bacterium]|nr:hypothetical protein [Patescibacteria group bacterium]